MKLSVFYKSFCYVVIFAALSLGALVFFSHITGNGASFATELVEKAYADVPYVQSGYGGGSYSQGSYGSSYSQGSYGGSYSQGSYGSSYSQGSYGGGYFQSSYSGSGGSSYIASCDNGVPGFTVVADRIYYNGNPAGTRTTSSSGGGK